MILQSLVKTKVFLCLISVSQKTALVAFSAVFLETFCQTARWYNHSSEDFSKQSDPYACSLLVLEAVHCLPWTFVF